MSYNPKEMGLDLALAGNEGLVSSFIKLMGRELLRVLGVS